MTGFTPGPWQYNDPTKFEQGYGKFSETAVYAAGNAFPWRMCEIQGPDDATEIANARLIAAAPELLEALEKLVDAVRFDVGKLRRLARAEEAIAKAKGETR